MDELNRTQTATPAAAANPENRDSNVDFKPYLEASTRASQSTRSTVYVLVVAVVIVFTAYRHTITPAWLDARLFQLQTASACLTEKQENTDPCLQAIQYSRDFLYVGRGNELLYRTEFKKELDEQINVLIRLRTEAMSLRLPFFGVVMDANDLGLVGGIFLASILYILHAWLYRDVDNLTRAKEKIKSLPAEKRDDHREHLLMTQVLTSRRGFTVGVFLLLLSVVVMHAFVLYSDLDTFGTARTLQGLKVALLETILDVVFFVFVCTLSVLCARQQWKLDRSVDELILEVDGPRQSLWSRLTARRPERESAVEGGESVSAKS